MHLGHSLNEFSWCGARKRFDITSSFTLEEETVSPPALQIKFSYVTVDESMCHFPPFLHQFKRASAVMQVLKYKPSVFLISAI